MTAPAMTDADAMSTPVLREDHATATPAA
ncbi:MAG: hypothetical protein RJA47_1617, partial [Actinomycetota bacterium]